MSAVFFFPPRLFLLNTAEQTDLKCLHAKDKNCIPPHISKSKS